MRRIGRMGLVVMVFALGCSGDTESGTKKERKQKKVDLSRYEYGNKPAPKTEGKDSAGKEVRLSDYKGKVVIVDFWFSNCGPCLALIPHEKQLLERLEGKPVAMVGVSTDDTREELRETERQHGITWQSILDADGTISKTWRVPANPAVFLVDQEGMIRYRFIGGDQVEAGLEAALAVLLERVQAQK